MKPTTLTGIYFIGELVSVIAAGAALFGAAGRLDWWPGWAAGGVWLVWFAAVDAAILLINPDLVAERLSPPRGSKTWDRALVSAVRLAELARYLLAGFDLRFGWTGQFPPAAQAAALAVCLPCIAGFAWAVASNPFFAQLVRIQAERGHSVVSGGPYRLVRHPAYACMIVFELALSTLLGSWWALAAGGVCAILLIARTALEDRTLQAELTGYDAYCDRVRYRLLPGIW